jgi:hypothetical protein
MKQSFGTFSQSNAARRIALNMCCGLLLIFLAACETAPISQTTTPTAPPLQLTTRIQSPTSTPAALMPPLRADTQLVYDGKNGMLLLFSGDGSGNVMSWDDTWEWNGVSWTQMHPAHSPSPRSDAAIAFDAKTGQVVLFGGMSAEGNTPLLADTWIWDGTDWMQQHPVSSPPARDFASMAYDAATGQLVLFGGVRIAGLPPAPLNDTWTWNGADWTQQHPATVPPSRVQASMAYDEANHTLVLFGGLHVGNGVNQLQDTWTWNGVNWIQQYPASSPSLTMTLDGEPMSFENPSMAYDETTRQIMLIMTGGDANGSGALRPQRIWFWNGITWSRHSLPGLNNDNGTLIYDPAVQSVLEWISYTPLINGVYSDVFIDKLWQWDGQAWQLWEDWSK